MSLFTVNVQHHSADAEALTGLVSSLTAMVRNYVQQRDADRALLAAMAADLKQVKQYLGKLGVAVMSSLNDLTAQVKANTDVEASAVTLIQGIAAQLAAAANDPVAVQALVDQLKSSADALASAITANTPAAPAA